MSWLLKMRKLCEKWRCLRCLKISVSIEANLWWIIEKKVLGREEISLGDVYEHNFPILTWMSKFRRKSCTLWTCARIRKVYCCNPTFLSKNSIRREFSEFWRKNSNMSKRRVLFFWNKELDFKRENSIIWDILESQIQEHLQILAQKFKYIS